MQDLLNEEEFLKPKPYNPWKVFYAFYALAIVQLAIAKVIGSLGWLGSSMTVGIFVMCLPIATAAVMFCFKKENFTLKFRTVLKGIAGLMGAYLLGVLLLLALKILLSEPVEISTQIILILILLFAVIFLVAAGVVAIIYYAAGKRYRK